MKNCESFIPSSLKVVTLGHDSFNNSMVVTVTMHVYI